MLDDLSFAFDLDRAVGDDGARDLGPEAPDTQTPDHQGKGREPDGKRHPGAPARPAHDAPPCWTTRLTSAAFRIIDLMISSRGP